MPLAVAPLAPAENLARLKRLAAQALAAADGSLMVQRALAAEPLEGAVRVLALGKAALAMARGAQAVLGERLVAGLIISPPLPADAADYGAQNCRLLSGGHPLPDERSLAAGAAACEFVATCAPEETLLVLLSGGASALCELPREGVTLADMQALQQELLACALPIAAINAIRQQLSRIKGGGLARCYRGNRPIRQLILSDVPGDDPAVVGSAPFVATSLPMPALTALSPRWRQWLQSRLQNRLQDRLRDPRELIGESLPTVHSRIVGSNRLVRAAVEDATRPWPVRSDVDYAGELDAVRAQVTAIVERGPAGLFLFGGECHLALPATPGRGGRNQHLALALQRQWWQRPGLAVLTLATDGVDGNSDAAGAAFLSGSCNGVAQQQAADAAYAQASSYDYWRAQGGLVVTGPTGSNVADLLFIAKA